MRLLVVCSLLFVAMTLRAQPAPDFTVTTSDGVQRSLYADYLNQNKTVLLKLFFTTCPPCNAMAPFMEPFYQEWGGGTGDAAFISLSVQSFDDNAAVAAYKITYGQTFPGVGADGGSITAATPYFNGTYGFYVGTPTFVVIAPDGKVTYNIRGNGIEGLLDSIDQAILRTGATKLPVDFEVIGNVQTCKGEKIAGVEIGVEELETTFESTDTNGTFDFNAQLVPRALYTLLPTKDTAASNGVGVLDIVKIQRHILGIEPFTNPYQLIAADVDRTGTLTVLDLIQIRKLLLSIIPAFPGNPSWIFLNKDYIFDDPDNPFPEVYSNQTAVRFSTKTTAPIAVLGIKIGDVDFSAAPKE